MHLFALFLTDLKSAYSSEILFIPISIFKTIIFQLGPCLHFMKTSEKNLQAIEQDMKTIFFTVLTILFILNLLEPSAYWIVQISAP